MSKSVLDSFVWVKTEFTQERKTSIRHEATKTPRNKTFTKYFLVPWWLCGKERFLVLFAFYAICDEKILGSKLPIPY